MVSSPEKLPLKSQLPHVPGTAATDREAQGSLQPQVHGQGDRERLQEALGPLPTARERAQHGGERSERPDKEPVQEAKVTTAAPVAESSANTLSFISVFRFIHCKSRYLIVNKPVFFRLIKGNEATS